MAKSPDFLGEIITGWWHTYPPEKERNDNRTKALYIYYILVGGFNHLKNDGVKVSWDDFSFPTEWKVIIHSMVPVTSNQIIIIFPLLVYTLLKPLLTTINKPIVPVTSNQISRMGGKRASRLAVWLDSGCLNGQFQLLTRDFKHQPWQKRHETQGIKMK